MSIHERILEAALRICRERGSWTFGPGEIVAALADLNPGSVRTQVMSRCCVNAPAHHAHRWPYFRRLRRGVYEILPDWRRRRSPGRARVARPTGKDLSAAAAGIVVEVRESGTGYVAEVEGGPGTFRSASLDEVAARVREAARKPGAPVSVVPGTLRLRVDLDPEYHDPVIEAYERDIDRTLVRGRLQVSFEERLLDLQKWMRDMEALRGAARRGRRGHAR